MKLTQSLQLTAFAFLYFPLSLIAQENKKEMVNVSIIRKDDSRIDGFAFGSDGNTVSLSENENGTPLMKMPISGMKSLSFSEPRDWRPGLIAYENGDYQTAAGHFGKIARLFQNVKAVKNNYGSRAHFLQLECFRHIGNMQLMEQSLKAFTPDSLDKTYQQQIKLFTAWTAVPAALKSGDEAQRLYRLVREYDDQLLRGDYMAQIAYLRGIAIKGIDDVEFAKEAGLPEDQKGREEEALNQFYAAFLLDYAGSRNIAAKAITESLNFYKPFYESAKASGDLTNEAVKLREAFALGNYFVSNFAKEKLDPDLVVFTKPLPKELKPEEDESAKDAESKEATPEKKAAAETKEAPKKTKDDGK